MPTTKLEHIGNKAARRRSLANLFHACMSNILGSLKQPGIDGVEMATGDGVVHRIHPILAVDACDYPEQVLVTCTKTGNCPKCLAVNEELGDNDMALKNRDLLKILDILRLADTDVTRFLEGCDEHNIKPVYHPFWQDLPYVDIYRAITADALHQIYQGVIKHVFSWVVSIYGANEIDARCRAFPPNHHIRIFSKGISTLSRLTGQGHSQMCRFLMGLLIAAPLPHGHSPARLVRAIRAILDFTYLAQLPVHSTSMLRRLQDALTAFHANKAIFIDLGIRKNMNLPKLHAFRHYVESIILFGTIDNYNTEHTERLHIDLAKEAHRATNQKDEFVQMTIWLERKEKIMRHSKFIEWGLSNQLIGSTVELQKHSRPAVTPTRIIKMTKHPTIHAVSFDTIERKYAPYFRAALARYITIINNPHLTPNAVETKAANLDFEFNKVSVYHKMKFRAKTDADSEYKVLDSIHAHPGKPNTEHPE